MAGGIKQGCTHLQQPLAHPLPWSLLLCSLPVDCNARLDPLPCSPPICALSPFCWVPSLLQFGMAHKGTSVVLYRSAEIRCGWPSAPLHLAGFHSAG